MKTAVPRGLPLERETGLLISVTVIFLRSLRKVFIPLVSGRPLCRQRKLDQFPPFLWRNPLCTLREVGRYVKLNYFCHGVSPSSRLFFPRLRLTTDFNGPAHSP